MPLAHAFAGRFRDFLPIQTYPIRSGTHFNTAFALVWRSTGPRRTTARWPL
jgi:hypothetical protein